MDEPDGGEVADVEVRVETDVVEEVDAEEDVLVELDEDDTVTVELELEVVLVVMVTELLGTSVMLGYAEYMSRAALNDTLGIRPVIVSFKEHVLPVTEKSAAIH